MSWNTNAPRSLAQGRYAVDSIFADSGGMGVIYDARDTRCANNRVLIKTTRYDGGNNNRHFIYDQSEAVKHIEKLRSIIEWEKKILVRFKKEGINNIPSINNYFLDASMLLKPQYEGRRGSYNIPTEIFASEPFLVMERMDGQTLEHALNTDSFRQNLEVRLLQLAKEILTIFIRIHRKFDVRGQEAFFIYQDLKPANILVGAADYFTLIDMGGVTLRLGNKTTEPTAGMLTYGYAAPEGEVDGGVLIDQRFDIYTLGATLYHAFTKIDPRELGGQFPKLDFSRLRASNLSQKTFQIVARALERDPRQRYTIAAEMRKDVIAALKALGEPV